MAVKAQIPCVFKGDFIREQIDPRIQEAWGDRLIPWGDFRKTWKTEFCLRVNPTGYPEDCPFSEESCAMDFMQTTLQIIHADRPGALFRRIAATKGAVRADQRPPARDRVPEGRPGDLGAKRRADPPRALVREVRSGAERPEAAPVSGRTAGPTSIGTLLGTLDLGARQGRTQDGKEGPGR